MNTEHSSLRLIDLPDELLLMIFKYMKKALALYSLMGINRRFDRILQDPIFVSHLTLMTCTSSSFIYPMYKKTIDRFCLYILPQIHHQVKWLNLEISSMKRLLLAVEYTNLCGLGLYNIREETDRHIFNDESFLAHILKNPISTLVIRFAKNKTPILMEDTKTNIFRNILIIFANLHHLNFDASLNMNIEPMFNWQLSQTCSSSILKELHITVKYFHDCLYLLDGCFNQLETFFVNIDLICNQSSTINDQEKLPNMKCFSLTCNDATLKYYELIVPLLHRMSNLESLALYLMVNNHYMKERFIDGNDLKENIINHLPRLEKFAFNIHSRTIFFNQIYLPSNEDIKNTFTSFKDNQIISWVDYSQNKKAGQCHIYSLPYTTKYYKNITNNFPGGLFKCVREISLCDEHPFEHEFFTRIAEAFPYLKKLYLTNRQSQQHKQSQSSKDMTIKEYSIIKYSHLTELDLSLVHDDYVEQFLDDTKTYLSKNIKLSVEYKSLQSITYNFTRETTRTNCAKINNIHFYDGIFAIPEHFRMYFPLMKHRSMLSYFNINYLDK
ncbi:unnamed protein product [Rotaria sp. Silwood2]|nr:unnamed protein product [Rotaria sp. Silwood2]CAF4374753.1 unnamed protein product [Rotaria sp. Silwood2]